MSENTEFNEEENIESQGRIPQGDFFSRDKLKDYGIKSLSPLVALAHKYKSEVTPYFDSVAKGLLSGADYLNRHEGTDYGNAEDNVSDWFKKTADGIVRVRDKLEHSSPRELIDYIESEAQKYPGVMFSTSYLAGLFLGRIGRHVGRKQFGKKNDEREISLTH